MNKLSTIESPPINENENDNKQKEGEEQEHLKDDCNIIQKDAQDMLESDLSCAICQDIYINPLILNCSHSFCKFCVFKWMNKNKKCPQCRINVLFQAENLALRNIINKIVLKSSEQFQTDRKNSVELRLKDEEKQEKEIPYRELIKNELPHANNGPRRNDNIVRLNLSDLTNGAFFIQHTNQEGNSDVSFSSSDEDNWVSNNYLDDDDDTHDDNDDESDTGPNRDDTFELSDEEISDNTSDNNISDNTSNEDIQIDDDDDDNDDDEDMDNESHVELDVTGYGGDNEVDSDDEDNSSNNAGPRNRIIIDTDSDDDDSDDWGTRRRSRVFNITDSSSDDSMATENYSNDSTIEYGTSESSDDSFIATVLRHEDSDDEPELYWEWISD